MLKRVVCCLALSGACVTGLAEAAPMDFGAAWYPEAWPKARRAEDVRLMKEAGFSYVRIGEFNWYGFEPREGEFRFEDFREVLDLLQANGLKAILCTPTAAPPRWLMAKYPNAVKTYASGRPEPPEMRRQYCYNDLDFRRLARRITEKMAEAYKDHPAILAWQVDNELSSDAEGGHCRCARCTEGFRAWLKAKYGTTDRLNAAWNAAFWSSQVSDWSEIPAPLKAAIPVQGFEYTRYQGDNVRGFLREQTAILHKADPSWKVCYNSWSGFQGDCDIVAMNVETDFASCDTYLNADYMGFARIVWDLYRSFKRQPFTIGETAPSNDFVSRPGATDVLRPYLWDAFARGCNHLTYFRWRRSAMGEEECPSVLSFDGVPGRRYRAIRDNIREFGRVTKALKDLPLPKNDIAVLYNPWDYQFGRWTDKMASYTTLLRLSAPLSGLGFNLDFVPVGSSRALSDYKVVVLPRTEHLAEAEVARVRDYVEKGGVAFAALRLNAREDSSANRTDAPCPKGLSDVFGLEVRESFGVRTHKKYGLGADYKPDRGGPFDRFDLDILGARGTAVGLVEEVEPKGCAVVESFSDGDLKGCPLFTEAAYGKGAAFYLAANVDLASGKRLWRKVLARAALEPIGDWPDDVARVKRGDVVVYTNVREEPVTFLTSDVGDPLLGPAPKGGQLTLPAYGVSVLKIK